MSALQSGSPATAKAMPVPPASGANAMAEAFAADRLAAFGRGDVEALLAQYADAAVVITATGIVEGRAPIRAMIEGIVAEFAEPGVTFELLSTQARGRVVMFTWRAQTAANDYRLGAETYVLDEGCVTHQTFAANVTPR